MMTRIARSTLGQLLAFDQLKVRTRYHVECRDPQGRLKWAEEFDNLVTTVGLNHVLVRTHKGSATGGAAGGYNDGKRIPAAWAASTAYSVGDVVRPVAPGTNNRLFLCEVAGTSAATEPVWPTTAGGSVADNTVTWREASVWFVGLKGTGAAAAGDTMASHAGWAEVTPYSNATRPVLTLGAVAAGSVDNSASVAVFTINATATVAGAFLCDLAVKAGTTGLLYGAGDFAASRSVLSGDTLNVTITLTVS